MALAIFDLDNTLLDGDSDHLWGVFLSEQGIVDATFYEKENERFYQEYKEGRLDINEFLRFSLRPLAENKLSELLQWRQQFINEKIQPIIPQASYDLIKKHQQQGDTLMIITATNAFVTQPITQLLGIEHLIATEPEIKQGQYTGQVSGEPSFQEGKVRRLKKWLDHQTETLIGSYFYSDSHNDLPLLKMVTHPVAVNPDEKLKQYAEQQQWPILHLSVDENNE